MDIRFECIFEGKHLFQVIREGVGTPLFTGTSAQCNRFMEVYQEKVMKARYRDRKSLKRLRERRSTQPAEAGHQPPSPPPPRFVHRGAGAGGGGGPRCLW